MTQTACEETRVRRDSCVIAKPPADNAALVEYVVAFTSDHMDCIICPKAYLDEQGVTALHSRKPYPIVMPFRAESGEAAMVLGMQLFRENWASAQPV